MDIMSFFTIVMLLSSAVIVLSEYASRWTKADGKWARAQSWLIAILIGIFGSWLNLGIFKDMDWKGGALIGVITALMANGIFGIDLVKKILEAIRVRAVKSAE